MPSLFRRSTRRDPSAKAADAGRRIRGHLEMRDVLRATVEEIHRATRPARTDGWFVDATGGLAHGYTLGMGPADAEPPPEASEAIRVRRAVADREGTRVAFPLVGPRSGVLGVVVETRRRGQNGDGVVAREIAAEAGFALETARLYEMAIAGREKSEAILRGVGDAIVVTDAAGIVAEWNDASRRILGDRASAKIGLPCAEALGLHRDERLLDCGEGCPLLGLQDPALGIELWRPREDGRRQPLLVSASPMRDRDGGVAQIVHSLRDLTRVKQADEAKTLFLATASHELKTPLTVIQGFAKLLTTSRLTDEFEREQALLAIERRAIDLNRIVERILLSSRIEAGRVDIFIEDVDPGPIVLERVEAFRDATQREISLDVPHALPLVRASPDPLATIVDHLLDNALKYAPDGEVAVGAGADDATVWISIADTGIGMDADQAARCFEKFWQAESSDTRRFGGTGIGLYIVRSLVDALGGDVTVESALGAGSTFTVRLARADTVARRRGAAAKGEPSVIREFMRQIGIPTEEET